MAPNARAWLEGTVCAWVLSHTGTCSTDVWGAARSVVWQTCCRVSARSSWPLVAAVTQKANQEQKTGSIRRT